MKKTVSLVLAAVLIISVFACCVRKAHRGHFPDALFILAYMLHSASRRSGFKNYAITYSR
ncbi:MAG: hypothetical protein E7515_02815 [Ruminococcaceae bacterium]|nr:hypothetical protein [Oscillospiraceae bacterium]